MHRAQSVWNSCTSSFHPHPFIRSEPRRPRRTFCLSALWAREERPGPHGLTTDPGKLMKVRTRGVRRTGSRPCRGSRAFCVCECWSLCGRAAAHFLLLLLLPLLARPLNPFTCEGSWAAAGRARASLSPPAPPNAAGKGATTLPLDTSAESCIVIPQALATLWGTQMAWWLVGPWRG